MPVFAGTAAADRIVGSAEADQIYGLDGNDTLYGGNGNDVLIGGLGADILVGGLGDDSYAVDVAGDQVVERAGEGTDRVNASISYQLTANVEILILAAGTADLNGFGNALDNIIAGNSGNNVLNGGAGDDILSGGLGNDVYDVDSAGDVVSEASNAGYDRVRASVNYSLAANVETLQLVGTADIDGTGNAWANTIVGNAGANALDGGLGDDVLIGGAGDDTYTINTQYDQIVETADGGYDRVVSSATSIWLGANIEALTLTGTIGLAGIGNSLDNVITGNGSANSLDGMVGNDVLIGGGGNDRLSGGAGADFFQVMSTSDGNDIIYDFKSFQGDKLVFVGLLHGTFSYLGAAAFTAGGSSEARFAGGHVFVDTDGNGAADVTLTLEGYTNASQLQASDFMFS